VAVTKLSFTKIKAGAKASLRYYTHRLTAEGHRTIRDIFDQYDRITKNQAYRKIDRAGEYVTFVRMIVSPDPNTEDKDRNLNLRDLTRETVKRLQKILRKKRTIDYLGIAHTDHSHHRHIHTICFLYGKIDPEALRKLHKAATEESLMQRFTLSADLAAERPGYHYTRKNPTSRPGTFRQQNGENLGISAW